MLAIYKCGYNESFVNPESRYKRTINYPKICILTHNHRYLDLACDLTPNRNYEIKDENTLIDYRNSIAIVDAKEGSTSTHKTMIKNYFQGSRIFINIGSAGAISDKLKLGSFVLSKTCIDDTGFPNSLMKYSQELLYPSEKLTKIFLPYVNHYEATWCIPTLYYHRSLLESRKQQNPIAVEMELSSVISTGMWLNHNFGKEYGRCFYTGVFYISDILPDTNKVWVDTLKDKKVLLEYKRELLRTVLSVLGDNANIKIGPANKFGCSDFPLNII